MFHFNQWTPAPLAAAAQPGGEKPTATDQRAGSMWTFTGHGPIIPEVAFLTPPAPIKGNRCIANPCFRSRISCFARFGQSSFYVYILLEISLKWQRLMSSVATSEIIFRHSGAVLIIAPTSTMTSMS